MVVAFGLEGEEFLVLRRVAVRFTEGGGEQFARGGELGVVEGGIDLRAREDEQAAAALHEVLHRDGGVGGEVGDVREDHGVEVVEARAGHVGRGDGGGLDVVLLGLLGGDGHEGVAEEERLGLARLGARLAVHDEHANLADGADGQRAGVVAGEAVASDARGDVVPALGFEAGVERDAARAAGRDAGDGDFIGGRAVHEQRDLDVLGFLLAVVGDLRLEAERTVQRRETTAQDEAADAEIAFLAIADEDEVGGDVLLAGLLLGLFQGLLDVAELPPAGELAVGDDVDFFANGGAAFERLECLFDGGEEVGGTVGELGFADGFAREVEVVRRLLDDFLRDVGGEDDGGGGAGGKRVHGLLGDFARLVEARLDAVGDAHARGVVEDDDGGDLGLAEDVVGGGTHRRASDGEREQSQHEAADGEENHVLDEHPALVLLGGDLDEAHRRPNDALEAAAVEQVDDDGHGDGAGPEEHEGVEEAHLTEVFNRNAR